MASANAMVFLKGTAGLGEGGQLKTWVFLALNLLL